ncbi:hypothetical protein Y032_0170g262 [Ancylostoma ceylanicum]|uniref:Uncharacterized protein n=1 Tax=Ancylostoma ceylanicum TaxID=53326 RepID=A0A016SV55_9BILA|nr:hypothetical protein Y032_0170g262 [Ancylostoma ceylanicum]
MVNEQDLPKISFVSPSHSEAAEDPHESLKVSAFTLQGKDTRSAWPFEARCTLANAARDDDFKSVLICSCVCLCEELYLFFHVRNAHVRRTKSLCQIRPDAMVNFSLFRIN